MPWASAAGTSALKLPPGSTVALKVCTVPRASVTVNCTVEPGGRSVVPLTVGELSLPSAGASTVKVGATLSMLPPSLALALPAPGTLTLATTL